VRQAVRPVAASVTLQEAKRLLQHSGLTAKELTVRLGRTDASDFTKFFRLRTGMTPGAFRGT
ncbi:helix-turn-helix domain-containing protein, partial [Streptomyces sp. NPDC057636]|uniref:helix-turn-helix domain-containing protein n=1 Tax=Streptomyces sp. NPDC057636 TaxID=3346189 RepID=UPI0036CDB4A6